MADGTAIGYLETHGDVESLSPTGDRVGVGNAYSTGHAEGTWSLWDGTYTGHSLTVGVTEGAGTATGRVELHGMQVDLEQQLLLGEEATLSFDVESLLAYSAIDTAAAVLDGGLEVVFMRAQKGVYDLIVTDAPGGIIGDFANVAISGLAAGQSALYGVTTANVGGNTVAVYRLQIVPEPSPMLLFALGLVALARLEAQRVVGRESASPPQRD